jgi:periplasmic divalent cation tolerance protein
MATDVLEVHTAVPAESDAERIGAHLVDTRLAACVQVVGPIRSTYRWQGRVEEAEEWLLLVKTTVARYPDVAAAIGAMHPYDEPEIIALPVVAGSAGYLGRRGRSPRWLGRSRARPRKEPPSPATRR